MKLQKLHLLRAISLLALLISFVPCRVLERCLWQPRFRPSKCFNCHGIRDWPGSPSMD